MTMRFTKSSAKRPSYNKLADLDLSEIARTNTFRFIAVLFVSDVFWLTLNRLMSTTGWVFYNTSSFRLDFYLLTVAGAAFFSLIAYFFCRIITFIPKIPVPKLLIVSIFVAAIFTNLITATFLTEGARYTSEGLTGINGIVYAISRSLSILSIILSIKDKYSERTGINIMIVMALLLSLIATIDGLSIAITISCFVFIYFQTSGFKNIILFLSVLMAFMLLLYLGFQSKFTIIPNYLTPEFALRWSIARMAISSEHLYMYISGESILNGEGEYLKLIIRSWANRWGVIFQGSNILFEYPRAVGEATYFDMYNEYGAGSSPGFYLGILLNKSFSFIFLFGAVYIFGQMFYGIRKIFNIVELYALVLITKVIHANISEYIVFLSPLTLSLFTFVLAAIIVPRHIEQNLEVKKSGLRA
ncbi:hypothetical protein [Parasphingorhabdus sp.]|uniref:hypothetical protein n=1 Tax=Parasphingorhabdus sp. TaxID=2709688 RepID=UPI002F9276E3